MNKPLFLRIVDRIRAEVPYFQQRKNAHGRYGLSTLQKCTAAIRMLAYGQAGDTCDEYLRLAESTALLCLDNFTTAIIQLYGDEFLRRPTPDDLQRLLDEGEVRGFPGMIGSIDCMHWEWKNCPTAWRGQYTRGSGKPTIVFDGIYPKWSTFIQSITLPQGPKAELFAERQESVRKDVERAFGVLQSRFAIVKNPGLLWNKEKLGRIMRACIILHNMIVEDERDTHPRHDTSHFESGESSRNSEVDVFSSTESLSSIGQMRHTRNEIRDQQIHNRLKADLVENLWQMFGNQDE
ncbi:hypothetical protein Bca4012_074639 [Brassica carinata]